MHISAARFFSWMRRQLAITRVYNPRQWWPGLSAHVFYCGGMAASVIASVKGYRLAELGLAASAFGNTIEWRGYRYRV
jgi:TctA family transporter